MNELATELAMEVPGCPDFIVEREVVHAAIEFCRDSYALQKHIPATESEPGQYEMEIPEGLYVIAVLAVEAIDGRSLTFSWPNRGSVITTDPEKAITARVALQPSFDAQELPVELTLHGRDAIKCLALARLLGGASAPWASPQKSIEQRELYRHHLGRAKYELSFTNPGPNLTVAPRRFI